MFGRPVRANSAELRRPLPGDDLIEDPICTLTHAVTVRRPPRDVWPWLVQMGAGTRAGWYSYDCLDNGRVPSATHIIPQLQPIRMGMLMRALPGMTDGFTVLAFEPEHFLVIGWTDDSGTLMTWAFVLDEMPDRATRLIARARGSRRSHFHRLPWWIARWIVPLVHFIMQRKQLLGIVWRAEHAPGPGCAYEAQPAR